MPELNSRQLSNRMIRVLVSLIDTEQPSAIKAKPFMAYAQDTLEALQGRGFVTLNTDYGEAHSPSISGTLTQPGLDWLKASGYVDEKVRNVKAEEVMVEFDNYDDMEHETEYSRVSVPKGLMNYVESVRVSHDGGRLEISINDTIVFKECSGTRDCGVEIYRTVE